MRDTKPDRIPLVLTVCLFGLAFIGGAFAAGLLLTTPTGHGPLPVDALLWRLGVAGFIGIATPSFAALVGVRLPGLWRATLAGGVLSAISLMSTMTL